MREEVGLLADKADNFVAAAQLQMPAHIHAEALAGGMKDISERLHKLLEEMDAFQ
jgi:hypothetical protein